MPEREEEPDITELPCNLQKQLIDKIVKQMSQDKLKTMYETKHTSGMQSNGIKSNAENRPGKMKVYNEHLKNGNGGALM